MIQEKIGLIGAGNMGGAILEGLFRQKKVMPAQVFIYDKLTEKAKEFSRKWGLNQAASNAELVEKSQIIILAIKPQDLAATISEFSRFLNEKHILISILAGTPLSKIKTLAGNKSKYVRTMPNLGAKVGQSMTAIASDDAQAYTLADEIFSTCGKTIKIEEKDFDLITALSGSGPAYFFLLMELIAKEGELNGLASKDARLLAIQTALGAALLAGSAVESPEELRKMVTSKGGTTEAALKVLFEKNFPETFQQALLAARNRGRELS